MPVTYLITGDDIRNRLVTMTSLDITDTQVASPAMIPYCQGWLEAKLGKLAAVLTTTEMVFAKAALIAMVGIRVIGSAPTRWSVVGPKETRPISAADKIAMIDQLKAEMNEALDALGVNSGFCAVVLTDDYNESDYTLPVMITNG